MAVVQSSPKTVPDTRQGSTLQDSDDNVGDYGPIIKQAKDRFEHCQKWENHARRNFFEDIKFANADAYNGYQWPNDIRRNRDVDERPCLTINKVRQHNLQIINDAKKNKPGIKIRATGNGATAESAAMLNALMMHVEYRSNATTAYDTATTFQVTGGIGYLRVITQYVDDDSFEQEPIIVRVDDPLTVFLDPDAKMADKSDMNYAFVFDDIPKEEFKLQYPEYAEEASAQNTIDDNNGWIRKDYIRVCEYFRKVQERDVLYAWRDPKTGASATFRKSVLEAAPELLKRIQDDPLTQTRDTVTAKVEWHFIVGTKVMDTAVWPGKYIPIVPVVGEETVIDGIMDRKGHTRAMIDPQRQYNYWAPLSLDTPLPTPTGWTTMGKVDTGDWLIDDKGKPCKVLGTSPVHLHRKCYRVEFDDGSHIIADGEHRWTVEERGIRKSGAWLWSTKTITTSELTPKKHFIYSTLPFDVPDVDLPINPYLLGAWLGDGTTAEPQITSGIADIEEMRGNLLRRGCNVGAPRFCAGKTAGTLTIHDVRRKFSDLGLLGNKHVPGIYLRASKEQRLELLRGFMDTDGSISGHNRQCSYTTINPTISDGFAELLRSLGIKAVKCARKGKGFCAPNGEIYARQDTVQFSFTADPDVPIFELYRKSIIQTEQRPTHTRRTKRHRIVSVTETPSVPVKCVAVDNESHLFLAGPGMVPTHNSAATEYGALQGKTPWMAPAEAIEGYETYWNTANKINHSVLPYNGLTDAGEPMPPPQRIEPPVAAPVALTAMQLMQGDLMSVSGQYADNMGDKSNERSAKAINERQRQGDTATYHFIDNLAIAIRQVGKILLDLVPKLYDTRRVMRIMANDGTDFELEINPQARAVYQKRLGHDGKVAAHILNPQLGLYEVEADIGPSWGTKREETFNALTLLLTQAPQLTSVIGDLLLMSCDFDKADEAAARLRRMVPPQALGDGPSQAEQQMQMQIGQLTELQTKTMEELAREKLKGHDRSGKHVIDSYKAFTDRLKVFLDDKATTAQAISASEVQALVKQTIDESLQTHLGDEADSDEKEDTGGSTTVPAVASPALGSSAEMPPVPGARKGSDGRWYVRNYGASKQYAAVG